MPGNLQELLANISINRPGGLAPNSGGFLPIALDGGLPRFHAGYCVHYRTWSDHAEIGTGLLAVVFGKYIIALISELTQGRRGR
jgi:hypothetical protein